MRSTLILALTLLLVPVAQAQPAGVHDADGDGRLSVLVVYDNSGPFAELGEIYSMMLMNLLGHFEEVDAFSVPTEDYAEGWLLDHEVSFYIGSTYDQPLPDAFRDDFWRTDRPLVWLGYNLWQLSWDSWNEFLGEFGFQHLEIMGNEGSGASTEFFRYVQYNGHELAKFASYDAGTDTFVNDPFVNHLMLDEAEPPETLATIVHSRTGEVLPYVVRKGILTHVTDMPFTFLHEQDRYLAFADLMHDFVGIDHPVQKQALFRLEDVHPNVLYTDIRQVTNELKYGHSRPWAIALVPEYRDPLGYYNGGVPMEFTMNDREARRWRGQIRRAMNYGADLFLHGWTHQYGDEPNPYNGVTADDFEFWDVNRDAPIGEDSYDWFHGRLDEGMALVDQQRWPIAGFEVPHYRASVLDYLATGDAFDSTWHRVVYYPFTVTNSEGEQFTANDIWADRSVVSDWSAANVAVPGDRWGGQFFPYVIHRDVYGNKVLPETLGNIEPAEFALGPQYVRLVDDLLANAEANLVVRDGFAAFFYHPYLMQFPELDGAGGRANLRTLIQGIEAMGYEFVSPSAL